MNINFARYTLYCRHMDISFPKLCESYVHLSALSVDSKQTNSQLRTSEYTGQTTSSMQATHLTLREILRQDIEPTPYQRYPSFSFSFPPPETIRVLHPPFPLHQTPTSKPTPTPQSQNNDTYIRSLHHSHFPRPSLPQTLNSSTPHPPGSRIKPSQPRPLRLLSTGRLDHGEANRWGNDTLCSADQ